MNNNSNSAVLLSKYTDFVAAVTSKTSEDLTEFMNRLDYLDANYHEFEQGQPARHGPNVNTPLLITACLGMAAEAGEFTEIAKKCLFQGKSLDEAAVHHMKRELGDVLWYWVNACRALDLDADDVIAENVKKLEARYPGGHFDVHSSEHRQAGDL